jgi:membrane carboxypeptidase/penicillin-binding protein PbpC
VQSLHVETYFDMGKYVLPFEKRTIQHVSKKFQQKLEWIEDEKFYIHVKSEIQQKKIMQED